MNDRRSFLRMSAAAGTGAVAQTLLTTEVLAQQLPSVPESQASKATTLLDVPLGRDVKLTIERRGPVVLLGLNRPSIHNRVDPETFRALAVAMYEYENDPTLRAAVLHGHGDHFSRGVDVQAFRAVANSGGMFAGMTKAFINPLNFGPTIRSKPLVAVVHGETWNMAHELFLASDIRVASANTDFGQDENAHGRFPGGGSTVRFPREAGWGNAMRYMLTGEHWTAQDALRMGTLQEVAATPQVALARGLAIATRIAECAPLGVQATLRSAHLATDTAESQAFSALAAQYAALYRTRDFAEGLAAQEDGRKAVFLGN